MRRFLVGVLLVAASLWLPLVAPACDVNVVNILSGASPDEAFAHQIMQLAQQVKAVGQSTLPGGESGPAVERLMQSWVPFHLAWSQNPPEWARQDASWTARLGAMATLVGEVQKETGPQGSPARVHEIVITLTRELMGLFDRMPMNPARQHLRALFLDVIGLERGLDAGDAALLAASAASISASLAVLQGDLASDSLAITRDFATQVDLLRQSLGGEPPTMSPIARSLARAVETRMEAMSQALLPFFGR